MSQRSGTTRRLIAVGAVLLWALLGLSPGTPARADGIRPAGVRVGEAVSTAGTGRPGPVTRLTDDTKGGDVRLSLVDTPANGTGWSLFLLFAGGAMFLSCAAGMTALLMGPGGRFGRRRTATELSASRRRANESAMWTVDRALRVLAGLCQQQGIPLPSPYLVAVDGHTISLSLTTPRNHAPSAWHSADGGRTWHAALRELQALPLPDGPAPYPEMVILGLHEERLVLLDISRAGGVIAVTGEPALRRALLDLWLYQLRRSPWSQADLPVVEVRCDGRSGAVSHARLEEAEEEIRSVHQGILVLGGAPDRREAQLLDTWVRSPDISWTFVVGGNARHARWILDIGRDGLVTTDFLANRVDTGLAIGA